MQLQRNICFWSRLVVLTWASLWLVAVPLFHIHPEADHHHGEVGHVHGGTAHTVMSPDLDCEVEGHGQLAADSQDHVTTVSGVSHRHLEIEFSLLTDSTDRKSFNPFITQVHGIASAEALNLVYRVSRERPTDVCLSTLRFGHDLPPRGPPSVLI